MFPKIGNHWISLFRFSRVFFFFWGGTLTSFLLRKFFHSIERPFSSLIVNFLGKLGEVERENERRPSHLPGPTPQRPADKSTMVTIYLRPVITMDLNVFTWCLASISLFFSVAVMHFINFSLSLSTQYKRSREISLRYSLSLSVQFCSVISNPLSVYYNYFTSSSCNFAPFFNKRLVLSIVQSPFSLSLIEYNFSISIVITQLLSIDTGG